MKEHRIGRLLYVGTIERNCRYGHDDVASAVDHGHIENRPTNSMHPLINTRTTNSLRITHVRYSTILSHTLLLILVQHLETIHVKTHV